MRTEDILLLLAGIIGKFAKRASAGWHGERQITVG